MLEYNAENDSELEGMLHQDTNPLTQFNVKIIKLQSKLKVHHFGNVENKKCKL